VIMRLKFFMTRLKFRKVLECVRLFAFATIFTASFISVFGQSSPPAPVNNLIQLMMSQPPVDISTPVSATTSFDPPLVQPGEKSVFRVTLNATDASIHWPDEISAPPQLKLRRGASGEIMQPVGGMIRPMTTLNYEVRASATGQFTLPEFVVDVYGKPVVVPATQLEVRDELPSHEPVRQLLLEAAATNLYVGETLSVRVLLPATSANAVEGLSQVQLNGDRFLVDKNSVRQSIQMTAGNGRKTGAFIYETTLTPISAGTLLVSAQGFTVGNQFGGPIIKDKTFFFANYELRRFPQSLQTTRIMPSSLLRQGILQFKDAAGNTNQYDLKTSMACGGLCDPRGLGISPTIQALWNMMPAGTDAGIGDGLNTLGLHVNTPAGLKQDFASFRLDHKFTDKVQFFGRYMYSRNLAPNGFQVDLRGSAATNPSNSNLRGDGEYGGLDWQLRPNLTNSFRAGWIRARQDFTVIKPSGSAAQLALPGTDSADGPIALAPGLAQTGFIDTVVDVDTQRARHQAIYDSSKQYNDMITWTKGKHTVSAGADIRWLPTIHDRDDKVVGSLNSLVAAMDADVNFLGSSATNRPQACAGAVTANCLLSTDVQRWDRLYAASLGLIDNVGILAVRDGNLNPKPLGASLIAKTTLRMYEFFVQDTWRMTPSLTLTYGLGYGWQTTPHELNNQQTLIANHDAGDSILNTTEYFKQKAAAAANGDFFNPTLSYIPVAKSGRSDVFNVDYGNIAPRVSAAWNPDSRSGLLGHLLGAKKTVVRVGYGIGYDRVNTVQSVIIPMLGVGFAQTINLVTPACNATGAGGANCKINTTPGGTSFRVGVDGSIPLPPNPGPVASPIVPALGFSETLSFQNDPDFKVGRSHMIDFTLQRELPGQNILEIGYVGRLGRNLAGSFNLNSAPYFFKDKISGQTFAQAFDAVAGAIRTSVAVPTQQWFENLLPGFGAGCGPGGTTITSTACIASTNAAAFQNGNVTNLFIGMDGFRLGKGLPTFNNFQVFDLFMRSHKDVSNYHALIVTLRNRPWHGLVYDMNYTFSKSLDTVGAVQNSASYYGTSFFPGIEYGNSLFDRTHVYNGTFSYDLPLGRGHRLGSSHEAINKIIGGWYTAGVVRFSSGVPLLVQESNQVFGGGAIFAFPTGEIPLVNPSSLGGGVHSNGNYFADPAAAAKEFRPILLSSDTTTGRSNPLRGFWFKNLDLRIGKITKITERVGMEYSFDFFNAFNHPTFVDPILDTTNMPSFGAITTQYIPANRNTGSRWIQFGLRVDF